MELNIVEAACVKHNTGKQVIWILKAAVKARCVHVS